MKAGKVAKKSSRPNAIRIWAPRNTPATRPAVQRPVNTHFLSVPSVRLAVLWPYRPRTLKLRAGLFRLIDKNPAGRCAVVFVTRVAGACAGAIIDRRIPWRLAINPIANAVVSVGSRHDRLGVS